jgi:ribonucleoside-diphosphate reductase alpha chain
MSQTVDKVPPNGMVGHNSKSFTTIEVVKGEKVRVNPPSYVDDDAIDLSANAKKVLERRYLRRDIDGSLLESVSGMFYRIASHIANVEEEHGGDVEGVTRTFYDLLTELRFFPNSPTFTGAGTPLGQLAACFVLAIEDDMGRDSDGIFSTLRVAALIQQTGGGNGFSFSRLRPKGDVVHTSAGRATGPVGFLRVYDQAFGEIAQGGCLLPETLVFTDKGLLRLDELVSSDQAGWQEHRLTVPTDEGQRTSPRGYNNGVVPVLQVKTDQGLTITGTYNHKVKVMTQDGPAWRRLDELQAGDAILVMLGQHQGRLQILRQPQKSHGNQAEISMPPVLDEELAFLLGYLAGDGFVASDEQDHRIGFSVSHDSYLLYEMPELLKRLFPGCRVHRQQKVGDASVTFVVDSALLKCFFLINGFAKTKSHEVQAPRLIRQSPPNVVGAYLRGLFEADGAVSHNYPELHTTSEQLAREVATLLVGLGAPVNIRHNDYQDRWGSRTQWIVRIESHVGLEVWRSRIGCDQRSRFVTCYTFRPRTEQESSYVLPFASWWLDPVLEETRLPQIDRQGRGRNVNFRATNPSLRRKLLRYTRGERNLTMSAYRNLMAAHPDFAQQVRPVENLWFVTVTGTEAAGEALTLDLEVDGNHTYLANGLVTHNTRRGANMGVLRVDHPDIEDFIVCKAEEGTISNFNISVAITDEFMQAVKDDADFNLRNPRNGKVWKTVRARDLFDKIVKYAHHNGEPGALFIDAANRSNPVPHLYDLEATNPCVTGDTLIYTGRGLQRAENLYHAGDEPGVVIDSRFGDGEFSAYASHVFHTGRKKVYQLNTQEGYELKATANHKVMTTRGWVAVEDLVAGDKVHILNHKGQFGLDGTLASGRTMGWLLGDGTFNIANAAGLLFFGEERALAPMFAEYVTEIVGSSNHRNTYAPTGAYPAGVQEVANRAESRVISTRLKETMESLGVTSKQSIPEVVYTGSEEMQRGFLQGLFSADGTVVGSAEKGISVRLWSNALDVLKGAQLLLLNFGIASRIYTNRKPVEVKAMPGGEYETQAGHELVISKDNLLRFQEQINFLQETKAGKLEELLASYGNRGLYREYFTATISSVGDLGAQDVYDLTEPLTHSFIANGIVVHNCGEQWLGPYENCCLGSINLGVHVTTDAEGNAVLDWEALRRTICESTHFLDNVVSANAYVPAVPEVAEAAYRARRIGLGIMGLGDLMYKLGIRYGSEEGQEFAAQVMEFVRFHCMQQSVDLAEDRGAFLAYAGSIYDDTQAGGMKWQTPTPLFPYSREWGRPSLDWSKIVAGIRAHGIRNAAQTTVAPTGTIATVSGCEGYGCEPVFALGYIRHFKDGDNDVELVYTSPLFEEALNKTNLSEARKQEFKQYVATYGSCQDLAGLPESLRHTFVVSSDITAEEHVRMQAAIQAFVDNSISKTCNFPEGATEEEVAKAYLMAWDLGCKGLTVYVTGSRQEVVLETKATRAKKGEGGEAAAVNGASAARVQADEAVQGTPDGQNGVYFTKRPRPRLLQGNTYRKETPLGTAYITVNSDEHREPFEVFLNIGKAGSDVSAVSEAIGRLISLTLRMPASLPPTERLRWVMDEMAGIGGGRALGFGANRVRSLPDGIAQVFSEHLSGLPTGKESAVSGEQMALPLSDRQIGDICPDCGEAAFLNVEGCKKCYICGYSEC